MKFSKEFSLQMVTEWQAAYMDYDFLKTLLKDIKKFRQKNKPQASLPSGLTRNFSLYRTFSGLHISRHGQGSSVHPSVNAVHDVEEQSIRVNAVRRGEGESYATTFFKTAEDGGEYELMFFRRLDDEFNKVVKFYKAKVEEVMKEALVLNKQMDALIAFRIKVDNPKWFDYSGEINRLATDIAASRAAFWAHHPSDSSHNGKIIKEVDEEDWSKGNQYSELSYEDDEEDKISVEMDGSHNSIRMEIKPAPVEILSRVKLNKTMDSPSSTIRGFLGTPTRNELKFTRVNLNKVEKKLKRAFIEFYDKLLLLQSYCYQNTLAFSKIMNKYDKITSRNAARQYMHMVDNSYLGKSEVIMKLMERVEETFIKHFSNSKRSKGMNMLRPKNKKEKHRISFFTGFFAGCAVALVIALAVIIHARKIVNRKGSSDYMETMFPLYSFFGFIVLHMILYAANIFFWMKYRVNYAFIFGFKKGTELGYREVLLPSFALAVLALVCVISNLDMEMDPNRYEDKEFTELLPLFLVFLVIIILLCPFNIIYRSSRYFFLVVLFRAIAAPLYKVTLPDFFMADQLTSQVQAFRSLEFYICYYSSGDYKYRKNTCNSNDVYNAFYIILAGFPFWLRFLQCVRRLIEEKESIHAYNALKYFVTIVAICLRTIYTLNHGFVWKLLAWIFSVISGAFCAFWDIYYDMGLLQPNSKNRWLRDELLVPYKSVYFVAMAYDIFGRFAWLQTVLDFQIPFLHRETLISLVAVVEVIRRGSWNFFRLENEHLNNVGHYRAFNSVPLPFNYHEHEEDEDE